ncbi:Replication factor A protein 2 [Polyrhizophydium stewartii]|uniref:Replication factor A protein 2 n=1 Tax=Polyrhizophydium stewartii TaxID=2732419 RepID=A0ABR4NDB3_9FUNG
MSGYGGYGGYAGGNAGGGFQGQFGQQQQPHHQQQQPAGGGFGSPSNPFTNTTPTGSPGARKASDPHGGDAHAARGSRADAGKSEQSLRSVTVKQLQSATQPVPDMPFRLDGRDLSQVVLVGRINSASTQSTNFAMTLDDGTGTVECKKFFGDGGDEEEEAARLAQFSEGVYVRVVGQLRAFASRKTLVLFSVRPVHSANEITLHCLEAITMHLALTRGLPMPAQQMLQQMQQPQAGAFGGFGGAQQHMHQQGQQQQQMQFGAGMFTPLQQEIMMLVSQQQHTVEGMALDALAFRLRGRAGADEVRSTVDYLSAEGHLYSTIDDAHFKATSA